MFHLSIITINYNNAAGLKKTLDSVIAQKPLPNLPLKGQEMEIEHIIVDGASTDGSVNIIREYAQSLCSCPSTLDSPRLALHCTWVSEPDKGIYNAMNKGIEIAVGRRVVDEDHHSELSEKNSNLSSLNSNLSPHYYIQILNSGDMLASNGVCAKMSVAMSEKNFPDILYGNMIKQWPDGTIVGKSGKVPYSLLQYFTSTMNHDCCYIRLALFEQYGLYDEQLKVVSDWKWFLQTIGLGYVQPVYVDIDVTLFDAGGISETNLALRNQERRKVLKQVLPPAIWADYDHHAFDMNQMDRLRRHHLYPLVYFIERVLFKLEKWGMIR